jgi:hypothetical protein
MKLHEITGEMKQIENLDFDAETIENTLDAVRGDFNDKAVAIIKVVENMAADTSVIDAEIERLKSRKQVMLNNQKRLRAYLLHNMEATGINKITCPLFTVSLRKGSESVEILDESLIPDQYVVAEVVEKIDKNAIKAALKAGEEIQGAALKRGETTIVIK